MLADPRPGREAPRARSPLPATAAGLAVAGGTFWIGYGSGAYGTVDRGLLAIAIWWAILLVFALELLPLRVSAAGLVAGGFLGAFAAWTLVSAAWAPDPERALAAFDRTTLYLGAFVLAAAAGGGARRAVAGHGLAVGISAIGIVALVSRLFPHAFSSRGLPEFLPSAQGRLSFPVGYWNGLAIVVALAIPLLLRAAVTERRALLAGVALLPVPALAAVVYLTSSRGGAAVALVSVAILVVLGTKKWSLIAAALVAAAGSGAAVATLATRSTLVNAPLSSGAAGQGRSAAVLIALACVGTMAAYAVVRRAPPLPEPSRRFNRAVVTAAALAAIAGLAAADPVERFRDFKRPPTTLALPQRDFARAHLLSGNGSGRWQFWTAAAEEWKSRPLIGRGAGSYESWWARNGSLASFVQYAHSLYLEALAELGLVGFVLVLGAVGSGFVVIVRRVRATAGEERLTLAALGAVFAGFALSAAIDWVWQLPLVPMVAFACLGLVAGSERPTRRAAPVLLRAGVASAAVLLVCAQAVPLLVAVKLRESQRAVREGDGGRALTSALAATRIASWAASPYLQLALVQEQVGELGGARSSIGKALERSSQDWRLWLVAARLDTKTGHIAAARRSLRRAEQLDPRSPLFANAGG